MLTHLGIAKIFKKKIYTTYHNNHKNNNNQNDNNININDNKKKKKKKFMVKCQKKNYFYLFVKFAIFTFLKKKKNVIESDGKNFK